MISYLIKCALLLALFYAFYLLFMRRTTFFGFNRGVLILGTLLCIFLPVVPFDISSTGLSDYIPHLQMNAVTVSPEGADTGRSAGLPDIALTVYMAGAAVVLVMVVVSIVKTLKVMNHGEKVSGAGYTITLVDNGVQSFNFMRHIVMSRDDFENCPAVFNHELAHLRAHHSIDTLFFSAVAIFQWFNPLVWLVKAELKMIHEYEADEAVINQGIDATQYQLLLVKKAVGSERFQLANGFNHAKLKNRINMMQKSKTNKWGRLAYAAMLPVLAFALCFCTNRNEWQKEVQEDTYEIDQVNAIGYGKDNAAPKEEAVPFTLLNEKPTFNGGDENEFLKWVNQRLVYPQSAKDAGEQGRILVSFEITAEGKMSNARIIRGVSQALDDEALRVVKSSPDWTPGKKDGKPVPVIYTFPIEFSLR